MSISRHRYLYASSNPISGSDPSGLSDLTIGGLNAAQLGFTILEIIALVAAAAAAQLAMNRSLRQNVYWEGTIGAASASLPGVGRIAAGYLDVSTDDFQPFSGTWLLIGATEGANFDTWMPAGANVPPLTHIGMKSPSAIGVGAQSFAGFFEYGVYANSGTIGGFGLFGFGEGAFLGVNPEATNGYTGLAAGFSVYVPKVAAEPAKGAAKRGKELLENVKKRLPGGNTKSENLNYR